MTNYGQFCTVARGSEILGERWTPLVVRELLCGSTHFNEIRRGLPRMSATLLAQRLKKLEEVGVLRRVQEGNYQEYVLTPAGEELRPIILAIGHWGARWIGSRLQANQLDAGFLMWDIRRFANIDEFPSDRKVVIHFFLNDARHRERHWWLVVANGEIDLCREDPGHELTLVVEASVASLTEIWTGDSEPDAEQQARRLLVRGSPQDSRDLWLWLGRSVFASSKARLKKWPHEWRQPTVRACKQADVMLHFPDSYSFPTGEIP